MKQFKGLLKFMVSIIMLTIVVRTIDLAKLQATVSQISLGSVALIVCVYACGQALSAFKWLLIARSGGVHASYSKALRAYFIGMFVNCFGFGTIGGDLARGLMLAGDKPVKTAAISSVIADRAHGLAVIACIGTLGAFIFGPTTLEPTYVYIMIACGLSIVLGWFFGPAIARRLLPEGHALRQKLDPILAVFPHDKKRILAITAVGVGFHLLQISLHRILGYSVGAEIPWAYLFVAIPFVNILSTLPISWNGLGVRETLYVTFLSPAVLSREQALTIGALWIVSVTICSAVGGIISALSPDRRG